jgi:hypothetical protein
MQWCAESHASTVHGRWSSQSAAVWHPPEEGPLPDVTATDEPAETPDEPAWVELAPPPLEPPELLEVLPPDEELLELPVELVHPTTTITPNAHHAARLIHVLPGRSAP